MTTKTNTEIMNEQIRNLPEAGLLELLSTALEVEAFNHFIKELLIQHNGIFFASYVDQVFEDYK